MPEQTSHSHEQQASSTPTLPGKLQAGAAQPSTQHTNSTSSAFPTQSEIADTAIAPAAAQGWGNWAYSGVSGWFSTGTQTTQTTTDNAAAADNATATDRSAAAVMNAPSASSLVPVDQVSAAQDTGNADAGSPMSALSETTSVLAEYAVDDFDSITGFVSELWDSTSFLAFDLVGALLVPDSAYGDLTQEELMFIAQDTAQPSRASSPEASTDDSFTGTIPTALSAEAPSSSGWSWLSWQSWLSWLSWGGTPASSSSAASTTEQAPTVLGYLYEALPSMHTVAFCAFAAAVHLIGRPTADGNHCSVVKFDMT